MFNLGNRIRNALKIQPHLFIIVIGMSTTSILYILVATLHMRRKVGMLNHTIFQVNHLTNNDAATIDEIYRQLKVGPY